MIVHDLDVFGIASGPAKADAKLIVHPKAPLARAIETCAGIIAEAPVDDETRDRWLERLWEAHQNDKIPCIDRLADYWGELCASRDRASAWANRLIGKIEAVWSPNRRPGDYSMGRSRA